jgi:hypothetical protein
VPRRNKRRTPIPWTAEEDALVLTLHVTEVVRRTNRTYGSVSGRKNFLNRRGAALPDLRRKEGRLSVGRWTWTPEADEIVFRHPPAVAAKLLGRTVKACWGRRKVLHAPPLARPPKPADNRPRRYQARWTEDEDRILRTTTAKEANRLLPLRSISAIHTRRKQFRAKGIKLDR